MGPELELPCKLLGSVLSGSHSGSVQGATLVLHALTRSPSYCVEKKQGWMGLRCRDRTSRNETNEYPSGWYDSPRFWLVF